LVTTSGKNTHFNRKYRVLNKASRKFLILPFKNPDPLEALFFRPYISVQMYAFTGSGLSVLGWKLPSLTVYPKTKKSRAICCSNKGSRANFAKKFDNIVN
jgi:hypothetical protein